MCGQIRMLRMRLSIVNNSIPCIIASLSNPPGPSSSYIASSKIFRFFFSGTRLASTDLISSNLDSRRGLIDFGSGAAPDDEDLSEEGTISVISKRQTDSCTIHCDHKIPCNHVDSLGIHKQFIITRINLWIPPLYGIQRCLRTQSLTPVSTLISCRALP